jgi:hypothetical protein
MRNDDDVVQCYNMDPAAITIQYHIEVKTIASMGLSSPSLVAVPPHVCVGNHVLIVVAPVLAVVMHMYMLFLILRLISLLLVLRLLTIKLVEGLMMKTEMVVQIG